MKRLWTILLGLAVTIFLLNFSYAAEHPGEHPGVKKAQEQPGEKAKGEHPGEKATKEHPGEAAEHPGEKTMLSGNDIIKGIKNHINSVTKKNKGIFPLYDEKENKDLQLKLVKVHEDRVSYIKKEDAYFACTDFVAQDGETMYDVDFWMKDKKGKLVVYQTKIHKKNGKPRFTYKDDEIVVLEEEHAHQHSHMEPEESSF